MQTTDLKNKKVLFIAPKFFGYEIQIVQAMQNLGASVYFHSDKPSENRWVKAILRLFPKFVWPIADRIYINWLNKQKLSECDVIFIVKGEAISPNFLRILHKRFASAKFIFYMWDSIANVKYTEQKLVFFNQVFSFDLNDCNVYSQIQYRPLFYIDSYQQEAETKPTSHLFFLGTLNGDRPKVLSKVISSIGKNVSFDYGLFVRSRLELTLRKLLDKSFALIDEKRLLFAPVSAAVIKQRMSACNCVLDIEHPKQTGLTMRTFEVLAAGKKLITTNQLIRQEAFYDDSRICIIDRNAPFIPNDFLQSSATQMPSFFYAENSLNGWLSDVLRGI